MLNLIQALLFCGFEEVTGRGEPVLFDEYVWDESLTVAEAFGLADDWQGWDWQKNNTRTFWRTYEENCNRDFDEVVVCCDRILIVDRTHKRLATTCRCKPEGCALAAELVRAWFATGR